VGVRRNAAVGLLLLAPGACAIVAPLDGLSGAPIEPGPDATSGDATTRVDGGTDGLATPEGSSGGLADSPAIDVSSEPGPSQSTLERSITVTAKDALPAGYTVSFSLDTASLVAAGKMRGDLDDLRVLDATGGADLDRVVDVVTGSPSVVWFQLVRPILAGASDAYSLRYGDPDAGAPPADGTNVFAFYDDFSGAQLAAHWQTAGAPVASPGSVRLNAYSGSPGSEPDSLRADYPADGVPAASAVEVIAALTDDGSGPDLTTGYYYWFGYQRQGDFTPTDPWVLWIARATGSVHAEENPGVDAGTGQDITQDQQADDYRIERAPSVTRFYRNGTLSYEYPLPNVTPYSLMLRNWLPQSDIIVSLVRAWLLVDGQPTVTLGAEQAAP
jgi:hypothetical protein